MDRKVYDKAIAKIMGVKGAIHGTECRHYIATGEFYVGIVIVATPAQKKRIIALISNGETK